MVYKEKNKYLLARKQVLISITTTVLLDSGYFRKESSLNKNYIYRDKTCLVKKKAAHVIETYCRDSIFTKGSLPLWEKKAPFQPFWKRRPRFTALGKELSRME